MTDFSEAHVNAFELYRQRGFQFDGLSETTLAHLREDPEISRALDAWLAAGEQEDTAAADAITKFVDLVASAVGQLERSLQAVQRTVDKTAAAATLDAEARERLTDRIVALELRVVELQARVSVLSSEHEDGGAPGRSAPAREREARHER